MRSFLLFAFAAVFTLSTAPAAAESPLGLSGEVGLVSDYRFRGLSLTDRKPALQGGLTVEHQSGAYAGVWSSTIDQTDGGANVELDVYAGYATDLGAGVGIDVMLNYYSYPSDSALNYAEAIATLSHTIGIATSKLGLAYAPPQDALVDDDGRKRGNSYIFGALDLAIPSIPLTLNLQAGHESGPFDGHSEGGKWDWQLGASAVAGPATLGLAYVDSNLSKPGDGSQNLAGPTVVASLLLSF